MNPRERILAIAVGALFVIGGGQWALNKYKDALKFKKNQYESLQGRQLQLAEKRNLGALADRQMGDYLVRSVSSNTETARSDYQAWLFEVIEKNEIRSAKVTAGRVQPVGDLYRVLTFTIDGLADMSSILGLVHEIQAKDFLHRMRVVDVRPAKSGEGFNLKVTIDVASLNAAPEKAIEPGDTSWRVESDLAAYTDPILNRNLFEPPNKAPSFSGSKTLTATIGRREAFPLVFKDPDGHKVQYELVDPPEDVSIDGSSGTLRVDMDELKEFDVVVRAVDNGYPKQSSQETLLVKVVDPPDPPKEEPPVVELKFDDAKQTYLTGLVTSGDDWMAWMNVRTRGKTLKLRQGDEFEIGSVKGVVKSINADEVTIQVGEREVSLTTNKVALKAAVDAE